MDEQPDRAALAEKLRAAEERAERAEEEAQRLRRELARADAPLAPAVARAADFRPALRLLVPLAVVEALGALAMLAMTWRDLVGEDVPPPAVSIPGILIAFLVWPALILLELGRGTRRGWLLLCARAVASALAVAAVLVGAAGRLGHDPAGAGIAVALALVDGVYVLAAARVWGQRLRVPAPRFLDAQGHAVRGHGALRTAALLGGPGAIFLGIAGTQLDRDAAWIGLAGGPLLVLWSGVAPWLLSASLRRDAGAARPWLGLRVAGGVLTLLALLGFSPYFLLFALLSKQLFPWLVAGWPLAVAAEIAIIVAAVLARRPAR